MFIFWLLLFIALAVGEEIKLSWDAKKYHQSEDYKRLCELMGRTTNGNKKK